MDLRNFGIDATSVPATRPRLAPPSSARIMAANGRCAGRKRTVCGPQTDGAAGANVYDGRKRTEPQAQTRTTGANGRCAGRKRARWAEAEFVGG